MSELIVREATPSDLDSILAIEEISFTVPWSRDSFVSAFSSDCMTFFAAIRDGKTVGFGCVSLLPPECEIPNIAVHPDERGKGTGNAIFSHLLRFAAEKGADTAFLEVRESNIPARSLYEKHGFIKTKEIRSWYCVYGT
jgi:ribosomal-protein-alanine N-acetyltransferase